MRTLQAFVSCAALTLTFALITSSTVFAQTGAGSVTGIITDQSGANVPGATVTATNQATNVAYTAVVNEAGNYTVTSLPVGTYVVKSELSGFKTVTTRPIQVEAMQIVRIDFTLEVGTVQENVLVTAEDADAADGNGDGRRSDLRHHRLIVAAERPQHWTALAAASRRRHTQPELLRGYSQHGQLEAGPMSTATGSRPTITPSTASI